MQNRKNSANLKYFGTKMFLMFQLRKFLPKLDVLFTTKKVICVCTFEVSCIKGMEKSEVIQKSDINH